MGFKLSGYRHPKTTQERRYNCYMSNPDVEDTLGRAGRNWKNLPTVYDDIHVCPSRNWKDCNRPKYRQNRKQKVCIFDGTCGKDYHIFYDELRKTGTYFKVKRYGRWSEPAIEQQIIVTWWV
jgi:hypothetical protein